MRILLTLGAFALSTSRGSLQSLMDFDKQPQKFAMPQKNNQILLDRIMKNTELSSARSKSAPVQDIQNLVTLKAQADAKATFATQALNKMNAVAAKSTAAKKLEEEADHQIADANHILNGLKPQDGAQVKKAESPLQQDKKEGTLVEATRTKRTPKQIAARKRMWAKRRRFLIRRAVRRCKKGKKGLKCRKTAIKRMWARRRAARSRRRALIRRAVRRCKKGSKGLRCRKIVIKRFWARRRAVNRRRAIHRRRLAKRRSILRRRRRYFARRKALQLKRALIRRAVRKCRKGSAGRRCRKFAVKKVMARLRRAIKKCRKGSAGRGCRKGAVYKVMARLKRRQKLIRKASRKCKRRRAGRKCRRAAARRVDKYLRKK